MELRTVMRLYVAGNFHLTKPQLAREICLVFHSNLDLSVRNKAGLSKRRGHDLGMLKKWLRSQNPLVAHGLDSL